MIAYLDLGFFGFSSIDKTFLSSISTTPYLCGSGTLYTNIFAPEKVFSSIIKLSSKLMP